MASISSLLNGSAAVSRALGAPSSITNALSGAGKFASSFGKAKDVLSKPASPNVKAGLYDVGMSLINPFPGSTPIAAGKALFGSSPTQQALKTNVNTAAQKQAIQNNLAPKTQTNAPAFTPPVTQPPAPTYTAPTTTGGAAMKQNPDGTFSLANPITVASTDPTPTPQAPAAPTQRDVYLKQIADSLKQTPDEISYQDKLAALQAQQANLAASEQLGLNKIQDQAIAMPFITGQQAALQRSVAGQEQALQAQQVPLQTRLAQLQAERARQGEVGKLGLEYTKPEEGFTLGEGQTRFDAAGNKIANTPASAPAMTPYQQAQLDLERQKMAIGQKPTEAQSKASLFAARTEQANPILEELGSKFVGAASMVGGVLPNIFKGEDRQKFEQARDNFITAVLRRESGAAIAPSEYAMAYSTYMPAPGDSAAVLAQKKSTRDLIQQGLRQEAGQFAMQSQGGSEEAQFLKSQGYDDAAIQQLLGKTNDLSTSQNGSIKLGSPLAVANNNPGNLRFVGQPGAVQGKGGFAKFESPEAGYQAMKNLLVLRKNQGMTLNQLINSYAPPVENDTGLYIKQISSALNVPPNTPLSQIDINALAKAMAKKESSTIIG